MNEKTSMNERKETHTTQESSQKISTYSQLRNTFIFVCRSFSTKLAHLLAGSARDCVSLLQKKKKKTTVPTSSWSAEQQWESWRGSSKSKRELSQMNHNISPQSCWVVHWIRSWKGNKFCSVIFFLFFYTCFSLSPTHLEDFSSIILKSHALWKGSEEKLRISCDLKWREAKLEKSLNRRIKRRSPK